MQVFMPNLQALAHRQRQIRDQHISAAHQALKHLMCFRMLQIQRQRSLVA